MRVNLAAWHFAFLRLDVSSTSDEAPLASIDTPPENFNFGKNWQRFVGAAATERQGLSAVSLEGRVHYMARTLVASFGAPFKGMTFLDVGCGSGLASLAALTLGVSRIISFDSQVDSVRATAQLREQFLGRRGDPTAKWDVLRGSVLDDTFVDSLSPAYLVYSYGVLHHTGDIWGSLRNIARLVVPEGLLFIAVHVVEHDTSGESQEWLKFKKNFNTRPAWMQEHYLLSWHLSELTGPIEECLASTISSELTRGSFRRFSVVSYCLAEQFHHYASGRGMDFMTDARDWLGGYPYTWTNADEFIRFCYREVQPSLKTLRLQHESVAGFLMTPAVSGIVHYFNERDMHGTGHWWSRNLFSIPSAAVVPWNEFVSLVDGTPQQCYSYFGDVIECSLRAWALSEDVRQEVKGDRCFVFMFPDKELPVNATLRSHFAMGSTVLEDLNILGWGAPSTDDRFCAKDGGARYRIWGSGLIVFSVWDDADPRFSGRKYQVLLSPLYSFSFEELR